MAQAISAHHFDTAPGISERLRKVPNLYQTAAYHAVRSPDAVAIVGDGVHHTRASFVAYVQNMAAALRRLEISKGDRVFAVLENSLEYLGLYYATALLGYVLVPVNVRLSASELGWMVGHADPKVVFYDRRNAELTERAHAGDGSARRWMPIEELDLTEESGAFDRHVARFGAVDDNDTALIIYTSGTTSRPKGAMITHANVVWNAVNFQIELNLDHTCRSVLAAPLFHIAGFNVMNGPALFAGGQVSIVSRFDAETMIDNLRRFSPTHLFLLSAMWVSLTNHPQFASLRFPEVGYIQTAAAPLSQARQEMIRQVFPNAEFGWGFGLTESCVTVLKNRKTSEIFEHPGSVGYIWRHFAFRLVDADGKIVEDPSVGGELQLKGPTIFKGYWQDEEATRAALSEDGWLSTGDLFRFDEDEFGYFLGRKKDMIKTGGENVSALEVEICILEFPGVLEAAVYGVPHDYWGEELRAAVTVSADAELDTEALRDHCRATLSPFKTPKKITIVESLPKSSSGKIQKFNLANV